MDYHSIKLSELNEFISCPVCHGYLIDATTVNECLHTFCKSCIVKHIKNNNHECPKCNTLIHEHRPLDYIIHDRSKQDIVYKLVPQLYISEMLRKMAVRDIQDIDQLTMKVLRKNYIYVALVQQQKKKPVAFTIDETTTTTTTTTITATADTSTATTTTTGTTSHLIDTASTATQQQKPPDNETKPIYLECPITIRVRHLRKLLAIKYQLEATDRLILLYKGDIVSDNDQISNLAQSISFILHYEISRLYPTLNDQASTSSSTVSYESDKMSSIDEIKSD